MSNKDDNELKGILLRRFKHVDDGLLYYFSKDDGLLIIKKAREKGFKYGKGEVGKGLYSPTWDRQLGEWTWLKYKGMRFLDNIFAVNPSVFSYILDSEELKEGLNFIPTREE